MVLNQLILDPPKSPANLGDFARLFAPLGKGGWAGWFHTKKEKYGSLYFSF
jgi:hypothetical protein